MKMLCCFQAGTDENVVLFSRLEQMKMLCCFQAGTDENVVLFSGWNR